MTLAQSTIDGYKRMLRYIEESNIDYKNITNSKEYIKKVYNIKKKNGDNIKQSTVKLYLVSTMWYLKIHNLNVRAQNSLRKEVDKISYNINKKVQSHVLIGEQENTYIEWNKIINVYNNIKKNYDKNKNNHINFALLSCYVLLCPRRLKDYSMMYVKKDTENIEQNKNYYDRKKKYFIFTNYKTSKQYKTQTITVPLRLRNVLDTYIDTFDITGSIFNLTEKAIQLRLNRIFLKHIDKRISVDILRHSYISWMKDTGQMVGNENLIAEIMGHTVQTQNNYYKRTKNIKFNTDIKYENGKRIIKTNFLQNK